MKQSKHLVLNTIALVFLTITSQNVFGQNLDSAFDNAVPVFVDSAETASNWPLTVRGVVVNTKGNAIRETSIAFAGREYRTNAAGEFSFETSPGEAGPLIVKKPGFRKVILKPQSRDLTVVLEPQVINGVYVQTGIFKNKNHPTMQNIMSLMKATELNAMVIDLKDDVGRVSEGLKPYVAEMHAKGLYMIARIVTFKDNIGPRKDPSLAIMDKNTGKPWEDSHGVTYLNPFNPKAHQYVINIAKRAVEAGFDEIEFDYVRFPTDGNRGSVQWSSEFTADSRTLAIATLLKEARRTLGGMGAFIAADVFGDTAYVKTDSGIGQRIEDITPYLDY
ncbi:MAG: hypothetical protein H7061_04615, partial [Bdellovibrionaceae bacterium]|nr:hypothetical protein [Bdellovibrio sp.]